MITLKSPEDIKTYRQSAGKLSKEVLRMVGTMIKPGISTLELDKAAESFIRERGGESGFKGFEGFPSTLCTSVNDQLVHGIPSPKVILNEGDIISIDTGADADGWAGDNAWTFQVGEVSDEVKALCECARDCLAAGIQQALPGNTLGDIGHAIQSLAKENGYGVVRDYVGHGIGHDMHEDPNVLNYGKPGRGVRLQAGMLLAIEPMLTLGSARVHMLSNGWTVVTDDEKPCAHFENVVAVTEDGPVILSADEKGPWCPMVGGPDAEIEVPASFRENEEGTEVSEEENSSSEADSTDQQ